MGTEYLIPAKWCEGADRWFASVVSYRLMFYAESTLTPTHPQQHNTNPEPSHPRATQYCGMYLKALEQLQQEGYPAHVVVENLLHPER